MKPLDTLEQGLKSREGTFRLNRLVEAITTKAIYGSLELEIAGVTSDSRSVEKGFLFVAIEGAITDGHLFIEDAISRGAVAVVSERMSSRSDLTWVQTSNAREALGLLSCEMAGYPSSKLGLIGITGTNGKTTIAYLITNLLDKLAGPTSMMGTVGVKIGTMSWPAKHTTPEAPMVQQFLSEAVTEGCRYGTLEVSSHGLALHRLEGTEFQVAVFTNLSRDHLDYHSDMEAYFLAKRKLFAKHLRKTGTALVCIDDIYGERLASEFPSQVTTYGCSEKADFFVKEINASLKGLEVVFRENRVENFPNTHNVKTSLLGRYNGLNLIAAIASLRELGFQMEEILSVVENVKGAPGRFEKIDTELPFHVVVDYAHTDDALRKLLEATRVLVSGKLWVVFGCGGQRDKTKRPLMGDVATRLADRVVITSDNPRSEDPLAIIREIQLGVKDSAVVVEPDRRRAIILALSQARKGDLVVIAGKGHEPYQVVGEHVLPFDDRDVVRDVAQRIAGGSFS